MFESKERKSVAVVAVELFANFFASRHVSPLSEIEKKKKHALFSLVSRPPAPCKHAISFSFLPPWVALGYPIAGERREAQKKERDLGENGFAQLHFFLLEREKRRGREKEQRKQQAFLLSLARSLSSSQSFFAQLFNVLAPIPSRNHAETVERDLFRRLRGLGLARRRAIGTGTELESNAPQCHGS